MKPTLRILHLEDSADDCELVHRLLSREGIETDVIRCENREKFLQSLEKKDFDLIFADCTLPHFSGLDALALACDVAPEIPFIFVSGTIEEDSAIESLRLGATDYVLKSRLSRLVPAVRRAVSEAKERAKNQDMEQRLRQAQRLEAVGTLAGGIAHDFNNILTIIKGYTSLLPMESDQPERILEIADTIDRATLRGSELVNQLLAFARKTDGSFSSTVLNHRVQEIVSMLRPAMPENIAFELRLEDPLPQIHADAGQVERVLINLATNARDAMPEGGSIIFATRRVSADKVPALTGQGSPDYICLTVTDTGCGMDEATRHRIFEPFFTTKPRGKGTGLGMPVVYGLMQSHNGLVDVQSAPGQGTTIALYFPIPTRPLAPATAAIKDAPHSLDGNETVLIVDDEPDVRYFLEVVLKSHGYRVLSAPDAETALQMFSLAGSQIDILFSDVGLPQIDGFELNRRAREIQPGVRTVMCSGHTDSGLQTRMASAGVDGFVSKPYSGETLLEAIRAALDK